MVLASGQVARGVELVGRGECDGLRRGRKRAKADEEDIHAVGDQFLVAYLENADARVPRGAGDALAVVRIGSQLRGHEGAVTEIVACRLIGRAGIQPEQTGIQADQVGLLQTLPL
jgi:hypothetical protein